MKRLLIAFVVCGLAITGTSEVRAQTAEVPEILVLGTFHMASPGSDLHNGEVDDVLSETRQREMAELMEVLRRFRPTKIAVEAGVGSDRIARVLRENPSRQISEVSGQTQSGSDVFRPGCSESYGVRGRIASQAEGKTQHGGYSRERPGS